MRHRALVLWLGIGLGAQVPVAQAFDLDQGNAATEVIVPALVPSIFASVAPGDAPLILHTTVSITTAWFDAIAPYNATTVGVYSNIPRRPAAEGLTDRNRNIAMFYASLPVLSRFFPQDLPKWEAMLSSVGLDPKRISEDLATPEGIGRAAGLAVMAVREHDGLNLLGDVGGRQFNRRRYADYTGYRPVNDALELRDPSHWQPAIVTRGNGVFAAQQFVTPQFARTLPYTYRTVDQFVVSPPFNSDPNGPVGAQRYKKQVDEVLVASANLTDEQKLTAELFNNKIESLGFVAVFLTQSRHWSVEQFVQYDFLVNVAAFDGGIAMWNAKRKYDAVRPFSAVRHVYGAESVKAWGGPGRGTVSLPASEWKSYLDVADHPEYPSGSSCFCAAHAQASRRYLGSDDLGWTLPYAKGSSRIEPGVTPRADMALTFETWSRFEQACGQSRLWGGVHFQSAIDVAKPICHHIGDRAYRFVAEHLAGRAASASDEDLNK